VTDLLILFGLPGAGKNYVARVLERKFGYYIYDADADLTPDFRHYVNRGEVVPGDVRDAYFDIVADRVAVLRPYHKKLAVTQAIIKEKHRVMLLSRFPEARFVWVQAPIGQVISRLQRRTNHQVKRISQEYAMTIASNFEPPRIPHTILLNDGDEQRLVPQIVARLASHPDIT